jgi:hypothetical protein
MPAGRYRAQHGPDKADFYDAEEKVALAIQNWIHRHIAAGRITDEDAILLIACLLLSDPHYYQIGGPDASGQDVTNHVSFLILEAAHLMGIPANLTVRVHDGLNRAFFLKSVEYLFKDKNAWPRYAGDKALTGGCMRNGYPAELARQRIAVGCHWFAIPGREYTLNDCVKINTAKVFTVAFDEMMEAARCSTSTSWTRRSCARPTRIPCCTPTWWCA